MNISLLKLIYKTAEFCTDTATLQALDKKVSFLQRTDPDICMEVTADRGYVVNGNVTVVDTNDFSNKAPTLTAIDITVSSGGYYITRDKMLEGYSDPENTAASYIVIKSIPANGTLYYDGVEVTVGQVIDVSQANIFLAYVRSDDTGYVSSFNYSAFDSDAQVPLESNTVSATLTVEEIVPENQPATVGDTSLYTENREVRVFVLADFTSSADPQYFDPEGDNLDAIRIDRISNTNQGQYLYYGVQVVENQVITATEISSGALVYVSPDINSIQTDVIEVSIRDTGSMEWTQ